MGNRYTKVSNIKEVRRGDHVSYKNGWFYHHAIVVQVDPAENTLTVIHYLHNSVGSKTESTAPSDHPAISYARVREEVIDFGLYATCDRLYRYLYEDHECVGAEEALAKARLHLDDRTRFNVRYNNCEDFAVRCKTAAAASVPGAGVSPAVQMGAVAAATGSPALIAMGPAPTYVTTTISDVIKSGIAEEKSKIYEMD